MGLTDTTVANQRVENKDAENKDVENHRAASSDSPPVDLSHPDTNRALRAMGSSGLGASELLPQGVPHLTLFDGGATAHGDSTDGASLGPAGAARAAAPNLRFAQAGEQRGPAVTLPEVDVTATGPIKDVPLPRPFPGNAKAGEAYLQWRAAHGYDIMQREPEPKHTQQDIDAAMRERQRNAPTGKITDFWDPVKGDQLPWMKTWAGEQPARTYGDSGHVVDYNPRLHDGLPMTPTEQKQFDALRERLGQLQRGEFFTQPGDKGAELAAHQKQDQELKESLSKIAESFKQNNGANTVRELMRLSHNTKLPVQELMVGFAELVHGETKEPYGGTQLAPGGGSMWASKTLEIPPNLLIPDTMKSTAAWLSKHIPFAGLAASWLQYGVGQALQIPGGATTFGFVNMKASGTQNAVSLIEGMWNIPDPSLANSNYNGSPALARAVAQEVYSLITRKEGGGPFAGIAAGFLINNTYFLNTGGQDDVRRMLGEMMEADPQNDPTLYNGPHMIMPGTSNGDGMVTYGWKATNTIVNKFAANAAALEFQYPALWGGNHATGRAADLTPYVELTRKDIEYFAGLMMQAQEEYYKNKLPDWYPPP